MSLCTWALGAACASLLISGTTIPPGPHGPASRPTAHADDVSPALPRPPSHDRVCGSPGLDSPWTYRGRPGPYRSGRSGLPTFGGPGTTYPDAKYGYVVRPAGLTHPSSLGHLDRPRTVYFFEPGLYWTRGHTLIARTGSVYIGGYTLSAGAAVLDANGLNNGIGAIEGETYATSPDVTIEYLTIENYVSSENNSLVNGANESGGSENAGWVVKYDTIGPNEYAYGSAGGYAVGIGSDNVLADSCITHNEQGAFNGSHGVDDQIVGNEISYNGLGEYPDTGGAGGNPSACGCSGGGKLFYSVDATITNNYVHNNYNVGIWLDFDNAGANISDNYIADNWSSGIFYEASYNANISDNVLVGNGTAPEGTWPAGYNGGECDNVTDCTTGNGPVDGLTGTPFGAIQVYDSGGNANLASVNGTPVNYAGHIYVDGNTLTDNFGGITVYTDTNRYPDNLDQDSTCSIPLGAGDQANSTTYYSQTELLTNNSDATVPAGAGGTTVTVSDTSGTDALCSNYGVAAPSENYTNTANCANTPGCQSNDASNISVETAPAVGMAVFDGDTNTLVGTVSSVSSATSFTVTLASAVPAKETGVLLVLSAYGGCGQADYFGGGPGVASGNPPADYWDNCNWGSRNITVAGNSLTMQPADLGSSCTAAAMCGLNGAYAFNAGVPALMQFWDSYTTLTQRASGGLGDVWSGNTYTWSGQGGSGQWEFMAGQQGDIVGPSSWMSNDGQDAGSTGLWPKRTSKPLKSPEAKAAP